jgi:hypothetical protein
MERFQPAEDAMRAQLLATLLLGGCGVKAVCVTEPGEITDCCTDDKFCENKYGQEYPYCVNPGKEGTCSECARDNHCQDDQFCDIDKDDFGICLDD